MPAPLILVTGSNGQLGKSLKQISEDFPRFEFVFLSRADMPIHHFELVRNTFKAHHPQYCINCAAYTNVDRAEQEKELAFQVNGEATGVLAAVCKEYNTRLIHLSTDYVFDGKATAPYTENFQTNPINVYGASKLEGELQALQFNPDVMIIRSSWVYSEYGKNFVRTMLELMGRRNEISVVNDQLGSPTYAADLAGVILEIISSSNLPALPTGQAGGRQGWEPGIYNYCNKGVITWFEFAEAIKSFSGSKSKINAVPSTQYPTPARRPAYSALDTGKIKNTFSIATKNWKESLAICIEKLVQNQS